jgi:hypothetical protein
MSMSPIDDTEDTSDYDAGGIGEGGGDSTVRIMMVIKVILVI